MSNAMTGVLTMAKQCKLLLKDIMQIERGRSETNTALEVNNNVTRVQGQAVVDPVDDSTVITI